MARLADAAVANNASWCDAVCRSHGYQGTFGPRVWSSPAHRVRFYPNAVTLRPEASAAEALAEAAPAGSFAVKDSYARLDLAPAGFRLLAEASWVGCDRAPGEAPGEAAGDDGLRWGKVGEACELSEWEAAWSGGASGSGPVFLPGLLADPRCAILACRRSTGDAIVAGAIVYAADGVAGISNVFSSGLPQVQAWAGVRSAAAALYPRLPLVGWEDGQSLDAARQAGFQVLRPLRVWVRLAAGT